MDSQIRVNILETNHSLGRGVGFYTSNLINALKNNSKIILTDKNQDLNHYPYFDLFYPTLPLIKNKPTVVTIHDVTPLAMPDKYPKGVRGTLGLLHQRLSLLNISGVITDSEYSKRDIVKFLGLKKDKVFVIPLAIDSIYNTSYSSEKLLSIKKKYNLPNSFILNVSGGPNPNKNLPALAIATDNIGIPLVIVGKGMLQEVSEPVHPELQDLVKLKKFKHVIYPGLVPTDDLVGIYQLASLYCQPSLYEGFGLPLLEAMAAKCLVVSSKSTSLPEIYPEGTITFDPKDPKDMIIKIREALDLSDKDKKIKIEKAKHKASDFSWTKTASDTIKVYQKVLFG